MVRRPPTAPPPRGERADGGHAVELITVFATDEGPEPDSASLLPSGGVTCAADVTVGDVSASDVGAGAAEPAAWPFAAAGRASSPAGGEAGGASDLVNSLASAPLPEPDPAGLVGSGAAATIADVVVGDPLGSDAGVAAADPAGLPVKVDGPASAAGGEPGHGDELFESFATAQARDGVADPPAEIDGSGSLPPSVESGPGAASGSRSVSGAAHAPAFGSVSGPESPSRPSHPASDAVEAELSCSQPVADSPDPVADVVIARTAAVADPDDAPAVADPDAVSRPSDPPAAGDLDGELAGAAGPDPDPPASSAVSASGAGDSPARAAPPCDESSPPVGSVPPPSSGDVPASPSDPPAAPAAPVSQVVADIDAQIVALQRCRQTYVDERPRRELRREQLVGKAVMDAVRAGRPLASLWLADAAEIAGPEAWLFDARHMSSDGYRRRHLHPVWTLRPPPD